MKSVREILSSRRFMRELSSLLFFFAAAGALIAGLSFAAGRSDPEVLVVVISGLAQVIVYAVLGIMLRRGSLIALWLDSGLIHSGHHSGIIPALR